MITIKTSMKSKLIIATLLIGDFIVFSLSVFIFRGILYKVYGLAAYNYINLGIIFLTGVFFFTMYDLYSPFTDSVFNVVIATSLSVAASSVLLLMVVFFFRLEPITAGVWIIRISTLEVFVVLWRTVAALKIKKSGQKLRCLIIENMQNTSRLARKLKYVSNYGRESTYYLINTDSKKEVDIIINEKLKEFDRVFISPSIPNDIKQRIMRGAFMLQKDVSILADLDNVSTMHGSVCQLGDTPVVEKHPLHITKWQRLIKRIFDILVSLVLIIITLPVFLICALAVKIDSKGPVFYKQERYTVNKKTFNVLKFRTMVEDAEKYGAQFATEDDPRITRAGKILRAMRLDELPQLYNILFGSMSVVGPRPERPVFADDFSQKVKNYDMRYYVKAGLTGYAQVYGKYNTRVSDKILMDLIYISSYSFLLDLKLILLTVKTMFVKSATEGLDEERDTELCLIERERARRQETLRLLGLGSVGNENIYNHSGIQL